MLGYATARASAADISGLLNRNMFAELYGQPASRNKLLQILERLSKAISLAACLFGSNCGRDNWDGWGSE